MTSKPELSLTPEGIVPSLLQHFNSMDVDILCGFYEPDAILVSANGEPRGRQDAEGEDFQIVATSNDIARRGEDGYWRYIIDNPFGTQVRQLA